MMASRGFARAGRSSSPSRSREMTEAEKAAIKEVLEEQKNDYRGTYAMIIFFSAVVVGFSNIFNRETALDEKGNPMKDEKGNEIKKLTTLGITLTVIFSLIIVMTVVWAIYRNRGSFMKLPTPTS